MGLTVPPKSAATRQRRNRMTTSATMEAPPATKAGLPARYSPWKCTAHVDNVKGCTLSGGTHDLEHFAKAEIEPHEFAPSEMAWRPMTITWWETIWDSPMAHEWVDADVPALLALAALVDQFWTSGDARIAAEIRLQQREFGLSPLSRRQLQWEIKRVQSIRTPSTVPARRRSAHAVLSILDGRKARSA